MGKWMPPADYNRSMRMRIIVVEGREYLIVPPEPFQLKAPSMKEWRKLDERVRRLLKKPPSLAKVIKEHPPKMGR